MNRRTRDHLDTMVRRAWPVGSDTIASHMHDASRLREQIDARLTTGPAAIDLDRIPSGARAPGRRLSAVLAAVVVLACVLAIGRLVVVRQQDQTSDHVDRTSDATAEVHEAIAATRAQLQALSVTSVQRVWLATGSQTTSDQSALVEQTDPAAVTELIVTANGDWSTESTRASMPFADVPLTVRYVAGEWYERGFVDDGWQHIVAEDDTSPMDVVGDDPVSFDMGLIVDAAGIVDHLERYEGAWTATPDPDGSTWYEASDPDAAAALAAAVGGQTASGDGGTEPTADATVRLWIDDGAGLVERIVTEIRETTPPLPQSIIERDTWLRLDSGSLVEAPRRATDISLDEWCQQYALHNDPAAACHGSGAERR